MEQGVLENQTIRMMVHSTIAGRRVRIRLSNLFGKSALRIGAAHIALFPVDSDEPFWASIISGTDHTLLFSGNSSVTIPAGQTILSDPADLAIPAMASIAVTLYLPEKTPVATVQEAGRLAAFVTGGVDFSGQSRLDGIRFGPLCWLAGVEVLRIALENSVLLKARGYVGIQSVQL
jgi:hypothetical protein